MSDAASFETIFGRPPEVAAEAPGRVNLIGEHTDYNGGFVLPTPIPQRTRVELAARDDVHVRVASADMGSELAPEQYDRGAEHTRGRWSDYVQGVTWALERQGANVPGFDARLTTTLPIGGGVSSSAALAVAMLRALRERFTLTIDDLDIARIARKAENEFIGAGVGIMDMMVSSLGREGSALFIDTRDLRHEQVAIPPAIELVVIDSGVAHGNATGEYNRRRQECETAASMLGVRELRDLDVADLPRVMQLPEPLCRRARHVITENARVLEMVAVLHEERLERIGELLDQSHASMRDDYEVSIDATDLLAELLRLQEGVLGARLTGGGFGGAVIALARAGFATEAAARAAAGYARMSEHTPRVLVPETAEAHAIHAQEGRHA